MSAYINQVLVRYPKGPFLSTWINFNQSMDK